MSSAVIFQAQSTMILAIMLMGIAFRKVPSAHVKLMGTAIAWDIILILQIELSRGAINTAVHMAENSLLANIHIFLALTTVILYGFMIYTGRKMLQKKWSVRTRHRALGWLTLATRIAVFVTSFWVVN